MNNSTTQWERYQKSLKKSSLIKVYGKVTKVVGLVIEGQGPGATVGSICKIFPRGNRFPINAEIVGFRDNKILLMPLGEMEGIGPGCKIVVVRDRADVKVSKHLLGRIIDGSGSTIDGKGPVPVEDELPLYASPLNPLKRKRINQPLDLGIRAVNSLITCGMGQRLGIFSGSGVGKSVFLGMIARNTSADVNVIALIGERGREVNDFIERDLGKEGLDRSVVIVATSDQPPLIRMRGAFIATAIAEYFRSLGKNVNLMMDSVTRFAMAQREVGLAIGEPPTTKGYTPSVFASLPKLLERAGTFPGEGSITGLYTVLVEGDDLSDPIADAVRSILDGHIVLSRKLASQSHYPAIDVLSSISRVMIDIVSREHKKLANRIIDILATYQESEDLINIGAYVAGSNAKIDYAIKMRDKANGYLKQGIDEKINFDTSIKELKVLFAE